MFREPILFPYAQHAERKFTYLSLFIEQQGIKLHFRWGLQDFLHDDRYDTWCRWHIHAVEANLIPFYWFLDLLLCKQGPSAGLIIIFDMKNVGYRTLLQTNVSTLKAFFSYLQNALPARLEAIHVLNCTSLFDLVLAMIKPFLKSDIIQRVCGRDLGGFVEFGKISFKMQGVVIFLKIFF